MGILSRINDLWSQADRWDKKENQQQAQAAAQRREEERKRREAEMARRKAEAAAAQVVKDQKAAEFLAKAKQQADQQQQQQKQKTVTENPAAVADTAARIRAGQDTLLYRPTLVESANKLIADQDDKARAERHSKQSNATKAKNLAMGLGVGLARFGASIPQAVGGAYDLVTPGEGQNRVSKFGTKYAELADDIVERNDFNSKVYRGTQIGAELLTSLGAGGVAKQGVMRSSKLTNISNKVDNAINAYVPGTSRTADFTRTAARELASPEAIAAEAYFANKAIGETAGRGEEVTPMRIASEYAFAVPGAVSSAAINKGIKTLIPTGSVSPTLNKPDANPTVDEAVAQASEGIPVEKPVEVSPGVSSDNLQNKLNTVAQEAAQTPPPAAATPPVAPDIPVATPPVEAPPVAPAPVREAPTPITQPRPVPQIPQTINPEIRKSLAAADTQLDESVTAPVVRPDLPEATPVETPITAQSKVTPAPAVVDPAVVKAEKLDGLLAQRQAMKDAGVDTKDIDAQIKAVVNQAEEAAPSGPVRADDYEALAESARNAKNIVEWREKTQTDLIDANGRMKDPVTGEEISAKQFFDNARATTKADDLIENAGIDPVTTEPVVIKPVDRSKKARALEVIEGASSRSDKIELYKEAKARGLIDTEDIPKEFRKEVLTGVVTEGMLPAKARGKTVAEPQTTATPTSVKRENPNVAQSSTTPVKGKTLDESRAEARAETLAGETELPSKPKNVTKQKEAGAKALDEMNTELPSKPKAPTASQLQKGARDNTTQSGKVSAAWKKQQKAAGATDEQIAKAVEKVEGRKIPMTEEEKKLKAQRDKLNAQARENKKQAKTEGRTKQAAPEFTSSQSRKAVKETGQEDLGAAAARLSKAYVQRIDIDVETKAANDEISKVSDSGLVSYIEKTLTDGKLSDDPRLMFKGDAILQRLDDMLVKKKISEDDMLDLAAKIIQSQAVRTSKSGQVQRITRELYQRVPAPVRVQKELDKMVEHFASLNKEFTPTKADRTFLTNKTRKFDKALVDLKAAETNMQTSMANILDTNTQMTPKQIAKAEADYKKFDKARTAAQKRAVESTQMYLGRMEKIKPKMTRGERISSRLLGAPDVAGNYLRMSMLSAPSGRLRDVFSTTFNAADQFAWRTTESLIGRISNKTVGSNLLESLGSSASRKKGRAGAWDKLKASYRGENTLDEATGRGVNYDRGELNKDTLALFGVNTTIKPTKPGKVRAILGAPKKIIRAGVQAPTDLSYGIYTDRLYAHGLRQAKEAGLKGDRAKLYARMFMEQPDPDAVKDSARIWLENSGMHDNYISRVLTRAADTLDQAGGPTEKITGRTRSTAERVLIKSAARIIRTTTIPFVQYMGGATHAMLINQNPAANLLKAGDALLIKKDPQKFVENLARGGWNTAKIGTLMAAVSAGKLQLSDTDASGENAYNSPYVVNEDGTYVPASTYGIAAGSAIIAAHYLNKAREDFGNGDFAGGIANSTIGPFWATIKASGMDNMLSGQNVLGGWPATLSVLSNNPDKDAGDLASAAGAGIVGDLGTQAIPAIFRDIDSFFNQNPDYNPTSEAPDTSGKDPVTGKVDPWAKTGARIKSGVPFWSDDLPRKSGSNARSFVNRIFNADEQSDQQRAAITSKKQEEERVTERSKAMFSNPDVLSLLSEEARVIHDKYKGNFEKASDDDLNKIWTEAKEGKGKLLEDGKYESHAEILKYELTEMEAKGGTSQTDIDKHKRKITRSEVAGKHDVDSQVFRMYTGDEAGEGGGISQEELNKMFDDESEFYDPDTAAALLALDQLMTEAGASSNSKGIDPWTRPKYREPKNGWGGSKSGSGKGSAKAPATDFGTLGSFAKPLTGVDQKYKQLANFKNVLPNLTTQSSKTNLKKKISIQKGVKL